MKLLLQEQMHIWCTATKERNTNNDFSNPAGDLFYILL